MAYSGALIIFIVLLLVLVGGIITFTFYMNNWLCFEKAPKVLCFKSDYEELGSVQVSDVGEDSEESNSDDDGRSNLDNIDAKTIAAEVKGMGEQSKYDDEARSDVSDERVQKFGTVVSTFKFEMMRNLLIIVYHGVENLPPKNIGGASTYELAVVVFNEGGRKLFKWNSSQFTANSFKKPETMEFPEMSAKDISSTAVRIRLYGCERRRRSILLSETVVGLGNVNLKGEQYRLKLEKRGDLKHLDKRNIQLEDENTYTKEMSRNATIAIDHPVGDQSELLLGLGYNLITGRLTVEIVKCISLKNPLSRDEEKLPSSFIKVTICASNNQEITRSKTEVRRNQANPIFKEKFMFQIPEFQLTEITLMIGVYHRKSVHRKEIIGWFSIGLHNSSSAESEQWKSMLDSNGDVVYQWHILQQNSVSRRGLPGAD